MKGTETIKGLTQEEVEQRIQHHQVNVTEDSNRDQTKAIFKRNIFTYFNAIFIILSVLVIIVGSYRSLTFMPVVIANTIIGIIQQLRAMKIVNQLSILAESKYQVLRDGKITTVPISSLVLDDIVILEGGCQIPADAVIVQGNLSVNESLLTGEADEIEKEEGNELRSGSFAITGHCYAKLTHVGKDSYVSKLTTQAKEIKEHPSEMIHGIDWFIKVAGILIIPVGIGLFIQGMFVNHLGLQASVVSMVGAVIGMIPEGLYLLVTVALALSSARLAKKQVLLHDMRSTESLARADVLCVDKTGTITDNTMKVSDLIFPPEFDDPLIQSSTQAFESYVAAITDRNLTMDAIQEYVSPATPMEYIHLRPFHSKVKFSEIETDRAIYRFGAPDVLLDPEILTKYEDLLGEHMEKGRRILAFVRKGSEDFVPLLFVSIENGLRPGARDTFRYLVNQEVDIKVISGDNPLTVSRVAESAGIPESDCYVDAGTLSTREDYDDAVQKYVVFGRVKPEQKKELVQAIQRQGLKVAMTGDGVNDILAMKEADCSIAMGNGSDAARQAAQVVLLDSDFSRMKDIIGEGRRDINNITRSAILFLYKNLFSLFLGIFSIIRIFAYPLQPSQVSLISMFNIGMPAFALALEPNFKKQKQHFISHTLLQALPASLTSFMSIALMVTFGELLKIDPTDIGVASTYLLSMVGFIVLFRISRPLNKYRTVVLITCMVGMIVISLGFNNLFAISGISNRCLALSLVFAAAQESLMRMFVFLFEKAQELYHKFLPKLKKARDTILETET